MDPSQTWPAPASMTGWGFRNGFAARTGQVTWWPRTAVAAADGAPTTPAPPTRPTTMSTRNGGGPDCGASRAALALAAAARRHRQENQRQHRVCAGQGNAGAWRAVC